MTLQTNEGMLSRAKIFSHPERLREWLETGITWPITVQIDPTNKCSYDCNQCAGLRIARNATLDGDNLTRIIDQLAPFIRGIEFTGGGEPLLNPATPDAIAYAKQKGVDVALITHGQLLKEHSAVLIVENCTYVRFSVDASTNEVHRERKGTRRKDSLDIVRSKIELLVGEKSKRNSDCTIGMSYLTDHDDTPETLRAFAVLARDCGVNYAQFRPYHHSVRDFRQELQALTDLTTATFRVVNSDDRYEKQPFVYPQAFADEFRTVIAATGEMYPDCFTRGIKNFSFGNLLKDDFTAIWHSERRQEVARTKLTQPNCPPACHYDPLSEILHEIRAGEFDPAPMVAYAQTHPTPHKNFV